MALSLWCRELHGARQSRRKGEGDVGEEVGLVVVELRREDAVVVLMSLRGEVEEEGGKEV